MFFMNFIDFKIKYFVVVKDVKRGMYECLVYYDYVICICYCNKYNGLCKYSFCVVERVNLLKEYVDFFLKFFCCYKFFKSNFVEL